MPVPTIIQHIDTGAIDINGSGFVKIGEYTFTADALVHVRVKLFSLNNSGANTLDIDIGKKVSAAAWNRMFFQQLDSAAFTSLKVSVFFHTDKPLLFLDGEAINIYAYSANASDTVAEADIDIVDALSVNVVSVGGTSPLSAADIATAAVDEFETQSLADPTGFRVNMMEVNGQSQTAGDLSAEIAAIPTASGQPSLGD